MDKRKVNNNKEETWFHRNWRPAVGWVFIAIILFDFIIAPGITLAFIKAGILTSQWVPLTLDAAGTFYIAMGVILGVTSWSRGQEKVEQIRRGYDYPRGRRGYDYPNDDPDPKDLGPPL